MSIENRIHKLMKEHRELDSFIISEYNKNAPDNIIRGLKFKKLALKDEITKLSKEKK